MAGGLVDEGGDDVGDAAPEKAPQRDVAPPATVPPAFDAKAQEATAIKRSLVLVLLGLVVLIFTLWDVTPGSFMVFALVAAPLVGLGLLYYAFIVLRVLRRTKGL